MSRVSAGLCLIADIGSQDRPARSNSLSRLYRRVGCAYLRLRAAGSNFDVLEFAPAVRGLARSLGACVTREPELQGGLVVLLLEELNELVQSEPALDLNAIVVEAMLSVCHEEKKESLYVGAISARVNKILEQRGELVERKPRTVGHRVKALGLLTRRLDAAGRGVLLLNGIRERIHKLAVGYQLPAVHGVPSCRHCQNEKDTPRGEIDPNKLDSGNLGAVL